MKVQMTSEKYATKSTTFKKAFKEYALPKIQNRNEDIMKYQKFSDEGGCSAMGDVRRCNTTSGSASDEVSPDDIDIEAFQQNDSLESKN